MQALLRTPQEGLGLLTVIILFLTSIENIEFKELISIRTGNLDDEHTRTLSSILSMHFLA